MPRLADFGINERREGSSYFHQDKVQTVHCKARGQPKLRLKIKIDRASCSALSHALVLAFLANIGMSDLVSLDMQVQVRSRFCWKWLPGSPECVGRGGGPSLAASSSPVQVPRYRCDPTQNKSETLSRRNSTLRALRQSLVPKISLLFRQMPGSAARYQQGLLGAAAELERVSSKPAAEASAAPEPNGTRRQLLISLHPNTDST